MDCPRCQNGEIVQITTSIGPYYCQQCRTYWKGPGTSPHCSHPATLAEAQASEAAGNAADPD